MDNTNDLIYTSPEGYAEIQAIIQSAFPNAVFEDASDEVHERRFMVAIPDVSQVTFCRLALDEGFAACSLLFSMAAMEHGGYKNALRLMEAAE
jgi:hypothetical protein